MAGCRIVNQGVETARDEINRIAGEYKTAGEDFVRNLNSAIAEMEGETKDALKKFIDGDVNTFVATDLPNALIGMKDLLEANRQNFVDVDKQIAESISGN